MPRFSGGRRRRASGGEGEADEEGRDAHPDVLHARKYARLTSGRRPTLCLFAQPLQPDLVSVRHACREEDAPEARRPAVLSLFGEDATAARRRCDLPRVVGVDAEAERVPGNAFAGLELDDRRTDCDAERPPRERNAERQMRRAAREDDVRRVRIPRRPERRGDQPPPHGLGRRRCVDDIGYVNRRTRGVVALGPANQTAAVSRAPTRSASATSASCSCANAWCEPGAGLASSRLPM